MKSINIVLTPLFHRLFVLCLPMHDCVDRICRTQFLLYAGFARPEL